MLALYFVTYLIICMIIGLIGKKLPLGFSGYFLLSFFLSPLVGIILLIVLATMGNKTNQTT